jgi:hypothetical protein
MNKMHVQLIHMGILLNKFEGQSDKNSQPAYILAIPIHKFTGDCITSLPSQRPNI